MHPSVQTLTIKPDHKLARAPVVFDVKRERAGDGTLWYVAISKSPHVATQALTWEALTQECHRITIATFEACEEHGIDPYADRGAECMRDQMEAGHA